MIIGNIVSESKIIAPTELNIVESIDEIDNNFPTLIVGWDFVEKKYPDYDITNRKISNRLFWTFKRSEKRDSHEEDLFFFINYCYQELISKIEYIFVDPIHFSQKMIKKCIRKFYSFNKIYTFEDNDMYYVYSNNIILGIDLFLLKYMKLNHIKVLEKIKKKSIIILSGDEIKKEYKKHLDRINDSLRYLPFLYSLNQE
jgi:hypothetical protein